MTKKKQGESQFLIVNLVANENVLANANANHILSSQWTNDEKCECVIDSYFPFTLVVHRLFYFSSRCSLGLCVQHNGGCAQKNTPYENTATDIVVFVCACIGCVRFSLCYLVVALLLFLSCKRVHRCVIVHFAPRRQFNRCCQIDDKANSTHGQQLSRIKHYFKWENEQKTSQITVQKWETISF